jgi:hypothetical protein
MKYTCPNLQHTLWEAIQSLHCRSTKGTFTHEVTTWILLVRRLT